MVSDDHDVTSVKVRSQWAAGVRHHHHLHANRMEHAYRERHLHVPTPTRTDINTDDTRDSSQLGLSSGPIVLLLFFSAQGISDTKGEEKMVRKCKRWNDH